MEQKFTAEGLAPEKKTGTELPDRPGLPVVLKPTPPSHPPTIENRFQHLSGADPAAVQQMRRIQQMIERYQLLFHSQSNDA